MVAVTWPCIRFLSLRQHFKVSTEQRLIFGVYWLEFLWISSPKGLKQSRLSSKGIDSFKNLRCEIVYIADYIVQTQQSQHYNGDTSFKNMLQPMQMNFTAWPVAWLGIRQPEGTEKRFINMILLLFEELKGWVGETTQTFAHQEKEWGQNKANQEIFLESAIRVSFPKIWRSLRISKIKLYSVRALKHYL